LAQPRLRKDPMKLIARFTLAAGEICDIEIAAGHCAYCRSVDHFTDRDEDRDCPIAVLGRLADEGNALLASSRAT
jgi:hypothetical protein